MAKYLSCLAAVLCSFSAAGCGTAVPDLEELPWNSGDEQLLVQAIVESINCHISNAVIAFIDADTSNKSRNGGRIAAAWFDQWGAQIALTLTIEEQTTISSNIVGLPPSVPTNIFTIGLNGSASADATRTEKLNFFYTVRDLYKRGGCEANIQPTKGSPSILIQNDLKLQEWLFDQLLLSNNQEVIYPVSSTNRSGQNVLSHEVTFKVTTSLGLTPAWKLERVTINQSGIFANTNRNRTSDLIVTFGPLDPKQNNQSLAPQAEAVHIILQQGLANGTNNNLILPPNR
jgi:hypothetical protein